MFNTEGYEMDVTASKESSHEAEWRERMLRFAASGQSVKQFCQAESISPWSFYRWRKQLNTPADTTHPAAFIDVGALPAPPAARRRPEVQAAPAAGVEVRLDLGHGLVLHIVRA
jgi:hypothetical protein